MLIVPPQGVLVPQYSLELLRWMIFEPILLKQYVKDLTRKESLLLFLSCYGWILLFSIILYIFSIFTIILIDIPNRFPTLYGVDFITQWQANASFFSKVYLKLIHDNIFDLVFRLTAGFIFGLVFHLLFGLAGSLSSSFAIGTAFGLAFGFSGGLDFGLSFGLVVGLAGGLAVGFSGGLATSLTEDSLIFGLIFGLLFSLIFGATFTVVFHFLFGLTVSLAVVLGFYLAYFRLLFYPYHLIKSFFQLSFFSNPYLTDGVIWCPLWRTHSRLTELAQQQPAPAFEFANFLLTYRPLQKTLAIHILHAATAGQWRQHPLELDKLSEFPATGKLLQPSAVWRKKLQTLKRQLYISLNQNHAGLKQEAFEKLIELLENFKAQTLRESSQWHGYYLAAIEVWQTAAHDKLKEIQGIVKLHEPITHNIYRFETALKPETDHAIFIERHALKTTVLTDNATPFFFVHGQHYVGKTTWLRFLPSLLGDSFKVIYQDLQEVQVSNVIRWMQDLKEKVDSNLTSTRRHWQLNTHWLTIWRSLQQALTALGQEASDHKIVLAFDEYEILHHYLQEDRESARHLFTAIRDFFEHQDQFFMLFVGTKYLSELRSPTWSKYFYPVTYLEIDYFNKQEARQLITTPAELHYPPEIVEHLFDITQGHPALLQQLCKKMVDIANQNNQSDLTPADLETAIQAILNRQNPIMSAFWRQFCQMETCQETIWQILTDRVPSHQPSLIRLKEHGYIVKQDEHWKIRVPLFESWLRKHIKMVH